MFSWLAILLTGMVGGALAWLFIGPVRRPVSDAGARPAVGWGWRLCWPWLDAVAQPCATALPWRWRDALTRWLGQAGTPAAITAPHAAALVACAAGLGASAGGVLGGLVLPAPGAWLCGIGGALAMAGWPILWIRGRVAGRRRSMARDLPFVLDMMTLCVESGLSLHGALQQAGQHGPPGPLRQELAHALADMRTGVSRAQALKALADRCAIPAVRSWVAALNQADSLGMSLGGVLRGHAAQCRTDRYQRAEKLAMEAPVKMLLPLIGCIFPCTFIVLAFPIAVQLWQAAQ